MQTPAAEFQERETTTDPSESGEEKAREENAVPGKDSQDPFVEVSREQQSVGRLRRRGGPPLES